MPSIRAMSAAPPKRMIVRIAAGIAFVVAIALYLGHVEARGKAEAEAADHVLALIRQHQPAKALSEGVDAVDAYGQSSALSRSLWAALMAGGGQHGSKALLRRTFAYAPTNPDFRLSFSKDGRFLAAIDGNTITVWNVEDGSQVLQTQAGDRFVGYWRIGAQHFGLLASYQYYDLVNSVIELPDSYRYAQASKDALSGVAPGGDWGYRVPPQAAGRSDYPIKLINLHTGEKREVDVGYLGKGPVAVNSDASRIAVASFPSDDPIAKWPERTLWNARTRSLIAHMNPQDASFGLYFSKALSTVAIVDFPPKPELNEKSRTGAVSFFDADTGALQFSVKPALSWSSITDDLKGLWFAVQSGGAIQLYRGPNAPLLSVIAEKEVSRAPATSH